MTDPRYVVYEALLLADGGNCIPDLTKNLLAKYAYLDRQDRSFIKRLTEGTIERRITIDHVLDLYSKVPVRKMKKEVRTLLRMGTYQLLFMDAVTDFAAVNETVAIAKKTKVRALSGYINAVLRNISQNKKSISWPDRSEDITKYLSVRYSCPEWIVNKLLDENGEEKAVTLLELSVSTRSVTARVNLSRTTVKSVLDGGNARVSDLLDEAVILEDYDNIADIPAFAEGLFCIQDIASMLVCKAACIKKDDRVLDLCASPGGKSLHAADIATSGSVMSCDVSEEKIARIRENIDRCSFSNIATRISDATVFVPEFEGKFDVVIADVPCSGLGVMGRKNDIKYNLAPEAITGLVDLQRRILANAVRYVRPGGTLMFSTCTCSKEENQGNMEYLTKDCSLTPVDFYDLLPGRLADATAKSGYIQLYGDDMLTDGFFIGKLSK